MADNSRVDWQGEQVVLRVQKVTPQVLAELAFMGESQAKIYETMVDTGFLRSTIYAATPTRGNTYNPDNGLRPGAQTAPPVHVGQNEAAIGAAAEYAVFIENKLHFLYRALEWLVGQAGGAITRNRL